MLSNCSHSDLCATSNNNTIHGQVAVFLLIQDTFCMWYCISLFLCGVVFFPNWFFFFCHCGCTSQTVCILCKLETSVWCYPEKRLYLQIEANSIMIHCDNFNSKLMFQTSWGIRSRHLRSQLFTDNLSVGRSKRMHINVPNKDSFYLSFKLISKHALLSHFVIVP